MVLHFSSQCHRRDPQHCSTFERNHFRILRIPTHFLRILQHPPEICYATQLRYSAQWMNDNFLTPKFSRLTLSWVKYATTKGAINLYEPKWCNDKLSFQLSFNEGESNWVSFAFKKWVLQRCFLPTSGILTSLIEIYPGVDPKVCIKPKIVAAKLGERSCGFCMAVIVVAPPNPSASAINAMHTYGWLPTNIIAMRNPAGMKWAVHMKVDCKGAYVWVSSTTYKIWKKSFVLSSGSSFYFWASGHR